MSRLEPALVLLAPSEEKAPGGVPGILRNSAPQAWVLQRLLERVEACSSGNQEKLFALKGPALARALADTASLAGEPHLLPAAERYTGVAFKALEGHRLTDLQRRRLFMVSPLRGLVRGDEPIPSYKLKLGMLPGLKAHWLAHLPEALASIPSGPVWALVPQEVEGLLVGWQRPRHTVHIQNAAGNRLSHASKHYRGLVARVLLTLPEGSPEALLGFTPPGTRWIGQRANAFQGQELVMEVP